MLHVATPTYMSVGAAMRRNMQVHVATHSYMLLHKVTSAMSYGSIPEPSQELGVTDARRRPASLEARCRDEVRDPLVAQKRLLWDVEFCHSSKVGKSISAASSFRSMRRATSVLAFGGMRPNRSSVRVRFVTISTSL